MKRNCIMKNVRIDILNKFKRDIRRNCDDAQVRYPFFLILNLDFWPVILFRLDELAFSFTGPVKVIFRFVLPLIRVVISGFSGVRINSSAKIDGGLVLHRGVGVVIGGGVKIGSDCTFLSGAMVAHKGNGKGEKSPIVGDNVTFMSGCKVLGPILIGSRVVVGANAVVLKDLPCNSVAVGIPAKILQKGHE